MNTRRLSRERYSGLPQRGCVAAAFAAAVLSASLLAGCGGLTDARTSSADSAATSPDVRPETPAVPAAPDSLPAGTRLRVRLLQSINSASVTSGSSFEAELADPVEVEGAAVFPRSTRIRGRVASAAASGRLSRPGYLRLTLDAIQDRRGDWHNIDTTAVSLQGGNHKRRNATLIGGGTGLGALIGGIAGGGTGFAIGALSGAGAGTVGALVTGKKDVGFAAERVLVFTTRSDLTLGN